MQTEQLTGRELDAAIAVKLFGSRCVLPFSSSWEAMRIVVEEMQRRGWSYNLDRWPDEQPRAEFFNPCVYEIGDTLPEAVAKAALKALENGDD